MRFHERSRGVSVGVCYSQTTLCWLRSQRWSWTTGWSNGGGGYNSMHKDMVAKVERCHRVAIRLATLYGSGCWAIRKDHERRWKLQKWDLWLDPSSIGTNRGCWELHWSQISWGRRDCGGLAFVGDRWQLQWDFLLWLVCQYYFSYALYLSLFTLFSSKKICALFR